MVKNIFRRVSEKLGEFAGKCVKRYEARQVNRLCNGGRMTRFAMDMRRKAVKYSASMTSQERAEIRIAIEEMDDAVRRSFSRRCGLVECGTCHWVGDFNGLRDREAFNIGAIRPVGKCTQEGCEGSCYRLSDLADI